MSPHPLEIASLAVLARWAEPWRHAFSTSVVISTAVLFTHVTSLVCAGGLSFAADRASLFSGVSGEAESEQQLHARAANRTLAIRALVAVVISGSLLFLSDVDSFVHLRTFWLKMGLVVLLISNLLLAQRSDHQLGAAGLVIAKRAPAPRSRYRTHARVSVALWLLTLLAGTSLMAG